MILGWGLLKGKIEYKKRRRKKMKYGFHERERIGNIIEKCDKIAIKRDKL